MVGHDDLSNQSLRVIADHIRSCSFLIADGVMPEAKVVATFYVVFVVQFVTVTRLVHKACSSTNLMGVAEVMGSAAEELKKQWTC